LEVMTIKPVVAVGILWAAGSAAASTVDMIGLSLYTSCAAGLLMIALWRLKWPERWKLISCAVLVSIASAGYYRDYDSRNVSGLAAAAHESEVKLAGRIHSLVDVDGDQVSFILKGSIATDELSQTPDQARHEELFQVKLKLLRQEEQTAAAGWQQGDHLELTGALRDPGEARNFGGFDYRSYLRYKHIHWLVQVKGTESVDVRPPQALHSELAARAVNSFRLQLVRTVRSVFPAEQAGFMSSMLIGYTDDMDPAQFDSFSRLGLTHILAISGLNVAIFVGCLVWVMRRLGFTRETYLLTALALLPLYIAVSGASPSIIRAGLMGMAALYASYRNLWKDALQVVTAVGLVMLLWEPYYIHDVSFQLSFLVTIGLIAGVPSCSRLLGGLPVILRDALSISVVSQLVSFPVSIYYFNQLSLLSLPANLLLVPVFSMVVMPAGGIAMMLGMVWTEGGVIIGKGVVALLNTCIFWLVERMSSSDLWQTIWAKPSLSWIGLYYAALMLFIHGLVRVTGGYVQSSIPGLPVLNGTSSARVRMSSATAAIVSLLCFGLLLWQAYHPRMFSKDGEVSFLDVGQGDSILVRTPEQGSAILIDGGGTVSFRKPGEEWKQRRDPYEVGRKLVVPLLKMRGVQRLEYVIATHEDNDHIGGLQAVLEHIPVGTLVFNGTLKPTEPVKKLFQTALDKKVVLAAAGAGQQLQVDPETTLHFLYPEQTELADAGGETIRLEKEQNRQSLVFIMEMNGTSWLFTGDMELAAEKEVIGSVQRGEASIADKGVDVLKIAHHGSKSSTSDEWLEVWKPKHAVISAGVNNIYRHPHPLVTGRLSAKGVNTLRTDLNGEIQMKVRDGAIWVRTKLQQ
jgi:competence protein ComEC